MLLVYFSKKDIFSMNILNKLTDLEDDVVMYNDSVFFVQCENFLEYNDELINKDIESIEKEFNTQIEDLEIIVVSKHKSSHDFDMITIHYTGNFNSADFGGKAYTLSNTNTKRFNQILEKIMDFEKPVFFIEATHHGPTISYPSLFFEIGPNEQAQKAPTNINPYVDIIKNVINTKKDTEGKNICIIGAQHYISKKEYQRILEKANKKKELGDVNLGHIMPKYALLPLLDNPDKLENMIREMIEDNKIEMIVVNSSYTKQFSLIKEKIEKIKEEKENLDFIKI